MEEEEIEITMTREDWYLFRKAFEFYKPTEKEKQRYADNICWIHTDWPDARRYPCPSCGFECAPENIHGCDNLLCPECKKPFEPEVLNCSHCEEEFPKSEFNLDCESDDIAMWFHKRCSRSSMEMKGEKKEGKDIFSIDREEWKMQ